LISFFVLKAQRYESIESTVCFITLRAMVPEVKNSDTIIPSINLESKKVLT
jgi:hypothetical protein